MIRVIKPYIYIYIYIYKQPAAYITPVQFFKLKLFSYLLHNIMTLGLSNTNLFLITIKFNIKNEQIEIIRMVNTVIIIAQPIFFNISLTKWKQQHNNFHMIKYKKNPKFLYNAKTSN